MSIDDFNPYEELGLNDTATLHDIRTAYKKQALRFHPDKPEGNSLKFKRIHQAYQILCDPLRRQQRQQQQDSKTTEILEAFLIKVMTELNKKLQEKLHNTRKKKQVVPDINVELDVDIKDVFESQVKKIVMKIHENEHNTKTTLKPFYISLNNYQDVYCFPGEGDGGSDIRIKLNIVSKELPHIQQDNIISKYNLYIEVPLSLYEYYYGMTKTIKFYAEDIMVNMKPYGTISTLDVTDNMDKYKFVHIIHDKGLPYVDDNDEQRRGDLYIHFYLNLPSISESVLETHESMLKTLFQNKDE
jgi:DnaJ-class molecular chaperone